VIDEQLLPALILPRYGIPQEPGSGSGPKIILRIYKFSAFYGLPVHSPGTRGSRWCFVQEQRSSGRGLPVDRNECTY